MKLQKSVEVRFGRWVLENSYWPEMSPLRIPIQVQFWDGVKFAIDIIDSFNENPSAAATFSFYRGNDRIIYRRKLFN
ncbi:MAG: hypothetical protein ACI86X_001476 [Moritella sp.]|jgi:hypothetical protein